MTFKSALRTIPVTAALLGAALFSLAPAVSAAALQELSINFDVENAAAETAVTVELKELRSLMGQLNTEADRLHPLGLSGLHWETHASRLNQIKDHVNRIGDRLEALQAMRHAAAPWQQEAIDKVVPMAAQVADRTTSAIGHLNENRQYLWAPQYVDHLRTISVLSDRMHGLVDNHLKIIEARDTIQALEEKLVERAS